jgi:hypothetical protein
MPVYTSIPKPTTPYTDVEKPSTRIYPWWSFIEESWEEVDELWSAYLVDSFTEVEKPSGILWGMQPFFSGALFTFLHDAPFALLGSYKPTTVYTGIDKPPTNIYPFWSFIDANWEEVDALWSEYQVPSWTTIPKPS